MAHQTGIMMPDRSLHYFVETCCGYAEIAHLSYFDGCFKDRFNVIASFCRCKDNWGIWNEFEPFSDDFRIGFRAFNLLVRMWKFAITRSTTLFLCEVPFVDHHNNPFAHVMNGASNVS